MTRRSRLSPLNISHWLAALVGLACLLVLAEVNGEVFQIYWLGTVTYPAQLALLVAGSGLLAWGLGGAELLPRHTWPRPGGWLVLITLLAFAVRVWNLENAIHFFVDEGNFAEGILHIREQPYLKLLKPFDFVAAFTWVYPVLQHGATTILGPNLLSLRIISVVFGTLTIPAVYQLGRLLYDRRIGLLAALLLAVLPPHVHFSRLGLNNIADPLVGTLALAYLVRALQQGQRRDYALAGLMLGLTQYFYEGGRLLYPPLLFTWAVIAYVALRPRLRGLLLTALVAVIVSAPVYYAWVAWDVALTTRLNRQGVTLEYWTRLLLSNANDGLLATHLREKVLLPLLHFISVPDQGAFFYGGHTALILPPLVPAFLVGIIAALRRQWLAGSLLSLWLAFTVLGNSLVQDSVWTSRYVVALPAVAVLLAVGLVTIVDFVSRLLPHPPAPSPSMARGSFSDSSEFGGIYLTPARYACLPLSNLERGGRTEGSEGVRSVKNVNPTKKVRTMSFSHIPPQTIARAYRQLGFVLLLSIAIGQIVYYFGPHLDAYQVQVRSEHDQQDIAFRVAELPDNTRAYLVTDDTDLYLPLLTIMNRYWGHGDFELELMHPYGVTDWTTLDDLWWGERHAFFVERNDRVTQDYLREKLGFDDPSATSPFNVPLEKQYLLLLYEPPLPGSAG